MGGGRLKHVILHDWDKFVNCFGEVGIIIGEDCYDRLNKLSSKNIIHQFPFYDNDTLEMNVIWKRIDYGFKSIRIDFDKCAAYLKENSHRLKEQLRPERFDMLDLTVQYLSDKSKMSEYDINLLTNYIQDYRVKSVDHYISHGTSLGGRLLYLDEDQARIQTLG